MSGGGFTASKLKELLVLLKPLEIKSSPIEDMPKRYAEIHWVKPELICEVAFSEWTADGTMRHPIFTGIRFDKSPNEVVIEKPIVSVN